MVALQLPGALVSVMRLNPESNTLDLVASKGISDTYIQAAQDVPVGIDIASFGVSAFLREVVITEDIEQDTNWTPFLEYSRREGLVSCWATFNEITKLAALICEAPVALINFIEQDRIKSKSAFGFDNIDIPLGGSLCIHTLQQHDLLVVPDTTLEPHFLDHPWVSGAPYLRFYAGIKLKADDGQSLGTLCVLDYKPRELSENQCNSLRALANQVMIYVGLMHANEKQAVLIQELHLAQKELLRLASTDPLSGLLNRRAFEECLHKERARIQRGEHSSTLLMIDFDDFKRVNDEFGHETGDVVIRQFAEVCRNIFRESDITCRWGGEEFAILLTNTSATDAQEAVERLHSKIRNIPMAIVGNVSVYITISVGMCTLTEAKTLRSCIGLADQLLYIAKSKGGNRTETAQKLPYIK